MKDEKELRAVYNELLMEAAEKDERVVLLEADLMRATGTVPFSKKFPERTVDVGVAEASMICTAAGLAAMGKIPFANTFCTFATRRCYDQIFISVAYAGLNVKIGGTDPGITAEMNGGTHMSLEDIGIMRNIPGMMVVEPVDAAQLRGLFSQIKDCNSPVYIRLARKPQEKIFEEGTAFTLGKSARLREGKDACIFATGIMVKEALDAAEMLAAEGIQVRVENMYTIKPVDEEAVIAAAKETGIIVTAENHSVINGLGSAVAEVSVKHCPVPIEMVGAQDRFGEVGKIDYLRKALKLTAEDVADAVRKAVSRKKG